jgi:hypothetical protein
MTQDEFWNTIARARLRAGDRPNRLCDALRHELENRMPSEVAAFASHYGEVMSEADTWELRAAASILRERCTDDDFDAFRSWLISHGEAAFDRVLRNVETLVELDPGLTPSEDCFLREYARVAHDVYEEMTGEAMARNSDFLPDDPSGVAWERRDLPKRFPKLWARFAPKSR